MPDKQNLFDEYVKYLMNEGFNLEGLGFYLEGSKVDNLEQDKLQEVFELVDEISKTTKEFKSKFYEKQDD